MNPQFVQASGSTVIVNDVHSRLNATQVAEIFRPRDVDELREVVKRAASEGRSLATCGGRHAMGGQQFARGEWLVDMTEMKGVISFDAEQGLIEMEAGAQWPAVIEATHAHQPGDVKRWGIRQKQTGADTLTLGGAVAANVHGRGLAMRPIVDDVEALTLVNADGDWLRCSRTEHPELFTLVVGGYGLFGIVATVTLRLGPRRKLRRRVDILDIDDAIPSVWRRALSGYVYGDFQYAIDPTDDSFLRRGVCACYEPVSDDTPVSDASADLSREDWLSLLQLAHADKRRAFQVYASHYLATDGRVYWSDTMQLSTYIPSYDQFLKQPASSNGDRPDESLMIGELYVPPDALLEFLARAREVLRIMEAEDIYGTLRTIQPDDVTFLRWAKRHYACVIFNLRTRHDDAGTARTAAAFRGLHDAAVVLGGSFFLTYHRWATRGQVEACYPQFPEFLALKRRYDPNLRFTSEWYRHYAGMFA